MSCILMKLSHHILWYYVFKVGTRAPTLHNVRTRAPTPHNVRTVSRHYKISGLMSQHYTMSGLVSQHNTMSGHIVVCPNTTQCQDLCPNTTQCQDLCPNTTQCQDTLWSVLTLHNVGTHCDNVQDTLWQCPLSETHVCVLIPLTLSFIEPPLNLASSNCFIMVFPICPNATI